MITGLPPGRRTDTAEAVELAEPNGPEWARRYRELLDTGSVPLLLDPAAPPAERGRWLQMARDAGPYPPGTVLLASSGTAGSAKLVARSVDSLNAEGERHRRWAGVSPADRVVLALPLWHAYALGWLHTCLVSGCEPTLLPPTGLAAVIDHVRAGATIVPLVPATARLLAARASRAPLRGHALRLAMAGAGTVDVDLDQRFRDAFGIGLARDYGSTETGSLFSATAETPIGSVGHPLHGIRFRVVGPEGEPVPPGTVGQLEVALPEHADGRWSQTADTVCWDDRHGLRVLGRAGRTVRRGDRWVAPEEIESVLAAHSDVLEARVQSSSGPLLAEVVSLRGVAADTSDLRRHAAGQLAPHKVPDRIVAVGDLPRGRTGKLLPTRRLTTAPSVDLVACAQAYKRTELLFALNRLGVLDLLRRGAADVAQITAETNIDQEVCEQLLRAAEATGLLRPAPTDGEANGPDDATLAILALEDKLSRSWVTREQLTELGRTGLAERAFDIDGPDDELRDVYRRAMHTEAAHHRSTFGLRLAGARPDHRLLEITCGPGRYVSAHDHPDNCRLLRIGTLAQQSTHAEPARPEVEPPRPDERFDVVVVCNAIHLPGPGSDLRALARWLAPGGALLIDDVFLDAPDGLPGEIRMDWLTHGGLAWPTEATTVAGLAAAGYVVRRTVHVGTPAVTLLLAASACSAAGARP
ncbi:AMP-binding protein [Micromonospora chokoriensis]